MWPKKRTSLLQCIAPAPNGLSFGEVPVGFWMAQQASVFVPFLRDEARVAAAEAA